MSKKGGLFDDSSEESGNDNLFGIIEDDVQE